MSSVWFAIPSARPDGGSARKWQERGYKVALFRDAGSERIEWADLVLEGEYPGYSQAVNALAKEVLARDWECSWVVSGGDDTDPDPREPNEIASECTLHFGGTFGVMQPTGDRWAGGSIDRICGSPWMGREFCERMNAGQGPFWPDYFHMFPDEEMQEVCKLLGVLWQRPDLTHLHHHFMRDGDAVKRADPPSFLREANSPGHWSQFQALFNGRKAAGFPGHEPLQVAA